MKHTHQWWLRAPVLGAAAFCLLGLVGLSAAATDMDPFSGQSHGPGSRVDEDPENVDEDRSRVVYHLVSEGYLVTSYDNITDLAPSGIDVPYNDAITDDDAAHLRFVIFDSTELVANLSGQTKGALRRELESGRLIVGAEGFGRELKRALGLIDQDLYNAGTTTGGEDLWVLLHRSPKGHLNELTIGAPHDDDSLAVAFNLARDWFERNTNVVDPVVSNALGAATAAPLSNGDDPWDAIHLWEWSGTTDGSFQGNEQTAGTYKFTLTAFTLASNDQGFDWYRLDFQTISEITNYEMTGNKFGNTSGNCGWWLESERASATVTTPGGQWWEFMPDTTVGSTTTGFTIGGNITTSQAGISGGYSQSYGISDVTISVEANSVTEAIDWTSSLAGCHNYEWYPDYAGASNAAKSTYNLNPSFIIAVPAGSTMQFTTSGTKDWGFTVRKDHIKCGFACLSIDSTAYRTTYTRTGSHSCNKTSCS